jgi:hypothetical protein
MKKFTVVERTVISGLVTSAIEAGPSDGTKAERFYQRVLRAIRRALKRA